MGISFIKEIFHHGKHQTSAALSAPIPIRNDRCRSFVTHEWNSSPVRWAFFIKTYRARITEDVDALTDFGFEIGVYRGKNTGYCLEQRIFEPAELIILIDAVQSSNFITEWKSREITEKLRRILRYITRHMQRKFCPRSFCSMRRERSLHCGRLWRWPAGKTLSWWIWQWG